MLADEIRKLSSEKVKLLTFSTEFEIFSEILGKSETWGEMHNCLRGMDASADECAVCIYKVTL